MALHKEDAPAESRDPAGTKKEESSKSEQIVFLHVLVLGKSLDPLQLLLQLCRGVVFQGRRRISEGICCDSHHRPSQVQIPLVHLVKRIARLMVQAKVLFDWGPQNEGGNALNKERGLICFEREFSLVRRVICTKRSQK